MSRNSGTQALALCAALSVGAAVTGAQAQGIVHVQKLRAALARIKDRMR